MHKKNRITLCFWSRRFASLWPLRRHPDGSLSRLPRLLQTELPRFVRHCPVTMPFISRLRLLDWHRLPAPPARRWFNRYPVPLSAYIGAYLVKLEYGLPSMAHLRRFLAAHPALVWSLGFPLCGQGALLSPGFDPDACLPSSRHFSRILRTLDNRFLQSLLDGQIAYLQTWLPASFGETVSLDTKHILAWVKENNPKAYIKEGRFDKNRQPAGDPDCKLGCKHRYNQRFSPAKNGVPPDTLSVSVAQLYWGYASGIVVAKLPGWGEFVLAEMTDTFDKADVRYFFPLMEQVEQRLGFRPRYAALDAAFDAFYVYDYFYNPAHDGFAAVPLNQPNGKVRQFDKTGLPLCDAGLPMPLRKTYTDRTKAILPHQRAFYACPLLFPTATAAQCPINHKQWSKGGCSVQIPTSPGARLRCQLDRDSEKYKQVYKQRTAVERIFSQAVSLGIERPRLRNRQAIANYNTLIYLLINLRAMQRIGDDLAD